MAHTVAGMTTTDTVQTSTVRLAVDELAPHISSAMEALEAACRKTGLETSLLELVRLRASQINGCVYCVNLHSSDARAGGAEKRLQALPVWRETPLFTSREKAALELTEAVTRLADSHISDELWDRVAAQFTDTELAELLWTITVINAWNRLGAAARPWPLT